MNIPIIFILFALFCLVLLYKQNKAAAKQAEVNENFLERERRANSTRKQDISHLDYIKLDLTRFPFGHTDDEMLKSCEDKLKQLSEQSILNLSDKSNTDLKLLYGPANLKFLSECDDNYQELADTLICYATRHKELKQSNHAITILEYACELQLDIGRIYLLLADLYRETNQSDKINSIKSALETMNDAFRQSVLKQLESSHTAE